VDEQQEHDKRELMTAMKQQCQVAHAIKRSPGGLEKWIGLTVKKGFSPVAKQSIHREWMWVEITGVEDGHLVGTLANDPVFATNLTCGDRVLLTEEDIFAVHE
jgi:uncharacterized protein YegJ (DUF2314 family)